MAKSNKRRFETSPDDTASNIRELGNKKKFHPHDLINLRPKNPRQEVFFDHYNDGKEVIILDGPAGCGKTFISLYAACHEVFDESTPYDQVVVVRSAVDLRDQGFLPGGQDEKNASYETPYKGVLDEIIKYKDNYDNMKALGYYNFITTGHVRGITLHRTIMIVDECQNLDYDELLSVLTRVGEHSKIIMIGSMRQNDLKRKRERSGFEKMKKVLRLGLPYGEVGNVDFQIEDSSARSQLVGKIVSADYYFGHEE